MKMTFFEWIQMRGKDIDNDKAANADIEEKFLEEVEELAEAFFNYTNNPNTENLRHLFEESFDTIQVIILILRRARILAKWHKIKYEDTLSKAYDEHNKKIINRSWNVDTERKIVVELIENTKEGE